MATRKAKPKAARPATKKAAKAVPAPAPEPVMARSVAAPASGEKPDATQSAGDQASPAPTDAPSASKVEEGAGDPAGSLAPDSAAGDPASAGGAAGDPVPAGGATSAPGGATAEPGTDDETAGKPTGGPLLRVTSRKPRRRAGRAFGPTPVDIQPGDLTKDAFIAIRDDPALTVEEIG